MLFMQAAIDAGWIMLIESPANGECEIRQMYFCT